MDPRTLTAAQIGEHLARMTRPRKAWLRLLAGDARVTVRELAARYQARRNAARAEARRLRDLYREERARRRTGLVVAGIDEVGRGSLAGPVLAAAVILPHRAPITGLDDSKRLTPAARERLDREIRARALGFAIGAASVEEIDRLNIHGAARLAMARAVEALTPAPDFLLIDGRDRLPLRRAQAAVVDGDACHACIAAASIVAKVARDQLMRDLDEALPGYGFAEHKGYGTAEHLDALARRGPSPAHRSAFLPVIQMGLLLL